MPGWDPRHIERFSHRSKSAPHATFEGHGGETESAEFRRTYDAGIGAGFILTEVDGRKFGRRLGGEWVKLVRTFGQNAMKRIGLKGKK